MYTCFEQENCPKNDNDSPNGRILSFTRPTRPASLPALPLSPLAEQHFNVVDGLTSSLHGGSSIRSINSPLVR